MDEQFNGEQPNDGSNVQSFSLGKEILEWVYTILIALAITFTAKYFVFDVVRVDGPSMEPTLMNNDKLIVTKLGYTPEAGDIIIFDSAYNARQEYISSVERTQGDELTLRQRFELAVNPPSNLKRKYYVKRVIATPGQTVDLDDEGRVLVDGKVLDEPYYDGVTHSIDSKVSFPLTVEEGKIFVMGDNRGVSKDSRSHEVGQVSFDAVLGKAQFRIWPIDSFGKLE